MLTLAAAILSTLAPSVARDTGAYIEARGVEFALIEPPAPLIAGTGVGNDWLAWPDADGVIRWRVDRLTAYTVRTTRFIGPEPTDPMANRPREDRDWLLPVTRAYRLERAIVLYREAEIIRQTERATIFDLEAAKQRVLSEDQP